MATESFDKKFVITDQSDVKRFYDAFSAKKPIKVSLKKFASPDNDKEVKEQLRLLFSR